MENLKVKTIAQVVRPYEGGVCTAPCTHPWPIRTQFARHGDDRVFRRDERLRAVELGNERARRTGVRQSVRRHTGTILRGVWVVQAIR